MTKLGAYGAQLKIGDGGGPEVFTTIAQVRDLTGPGLSLDTLDVTTHDSTDAWRDFIGGLKDGGEVTFEVVYDPDSVTQTAVRTDLDGRTNRNFKLVFPDGTATEWAFAGYVTEFEPSLPVEDEMSASMTIKVTGEPTLA